MVARPQAEVTKLAEGAGLGRFEEQFDNRHRAPMPLVGVLTAVAVAVAVLAGRHRVGFVALGVIPLTLFGCLLYTLRTPVGGRRWFALFEHGYVDRQADRPADEDPEAHRWTEVSAVEFTPAGLELALAGPPHRVPLAGLDRPTDLLAAVNRHVLPPTAPVGATAAGARTGAVSKPPHRLARWSGWTLTGLALAPCVLYPVYNAANPRPGAVPHQVAAGPAASRSATAPWATASPFPPASPAPDLPNAATLTDLAGYADVCTGRHYADAAPYPGPRPHRFAIFSNFTMNWTDGTMPSDSKAVLHPWYATDVRTVQLVACVALARGTLREHCGQYTNGLPTVRVDLYYGQYTITLYAARTGLKVAGPIRLRGSDDTDCPPTISVDQNQTELDIFTSLSGQQVKTALKSYVA